jgi:DNA-directed RNA polymerase subunit beta'
LKTLYDFFAKPTDPRVFSGVKINLASSDKIMEWSNGEIKKPETINYRTFKPEQDGLFCAKIFGPIKDYECNCGKYKRMKHRGVVCEKCGVEVILSKVRRERMGHISLVTPCSHIWFLKSLPSKIGTLLDITLKKIEKVLYFDSYIVLDPKKTALAKCQVLSEAEYLEALQDSGDFKAGIGAEAVKELLEGLDLEAIHKELKEELLNTKSEAKKNKISKRLKILGFFRKSGINPAWMIMNIVPVIPPDLRPLVSLEGGRFATSDLNDLYRRVINRNSRLKRLSGLNAPEIILRNERRMLQESVDVLFDNGRHGRVITGSNKRPLKSLSDILKGKEGRFRLNLLGKRVDYSGRTVITIGPHLRLHQCGLPKKMALELFKPFIYFKLEQKSLVSTMKTAKKMVESELPEVWDALDEVVKEYPVLLNRAPTLHRLGVQAFEPILIEGKAIQLHPLVCTAFNADFDGDQMAVHVPLSVESQVEARIIMLASNNILFPANGVPSIVPTQDIVLGIYYLTLMHDGLEGENKIFSSSDEVRVAYDAGAIALHARVNVRMGGERVETTPGRVILWEVIPKDSILHLRHIHLKTRDKAEELLEKISAGESFIDLVEEYSTALNSSLSGDIGLLRQEEFKRVFEFTDTDIENLYGLMTGEVSEIIEAEDGFHAFEVIEQKTEIPFSIVNKVQNKKSLANLIDYAYRKLGTKATVILSDKLKDIGYEFSTKSGSSICINDMFIPASKQVILKEAEKEVEKIENQYNEGLITQGEKYNKVVDIWTKATDAVANAMMDAMKSASSMDNDDNSSNKAEKENNKVNSIFMMADSGARGSKDQMRQLAGMRGLMAKPSGEIIENPITANFREGLSVLQYFISTHGARKGLADTALKTANSGYLTRRLADVSHDCIISEHDCKTTKGIEVESLVEGGEIIQPLGERILGRIVAEDILDPFSDNIIIKTGEEIDEKKQKIIEDYGVKKVVIRSVLTCQSKKGVCSMCYGRDLAYGTIIEIGQAVGIIAAQSIGEPGTQLTMRTFHIGGAASQKTEQTDIRSKVEGRVKYIDLNVVKNAKNKLIVTNRRGGEIAIIGENGRERERFPVIYGAYLEVEDGQKVQEGDKLANWDPFTTPILTEVGGIVRFKDIKAGDTMQERVDSVTGKSSKTIIESRNYANVRPRITIKGKSGRIVQIPNSNSEARYFLPVNAILLVDEGDVITAGDILAKLPRATTKTTDITGGLPRVAELLEVRKPKDTAVISEIDGYISISAGPRGKQKITVAPVDDVGEEKDYLVVKGKHINVYEGDYVRSGDAMTGGSANPQDLLDIQGELALARYIVDRVQEVYRLQGVKINDKHIEVIVRQMMRRIKVSDSGDSDFLVEDLIDRDIFNIKNREIIEKDGKPAIGSPVILGITKASLNTESFISAASFQETTKVLTEASIAGKEDYLKGLKENVIMGRIVPAGTGLLRYSDIELEA